MVDVPLYQQSWAAGSSTFCDRSDYFYRRIDDGIDPLYPEIAHAEGFRLTGDSHLYSPELGGYTYATSSLQIDKFPTASLTIPEGYAQFRYKPTAASLDANAWFSLVSMNAFGMFIELKLPPRSNANKLNLYADGYSSPGVYVGAIDELVAFTPVAGTPYLFRFEWKTGVGGYAKWYLDGVLLYENLSFPVFFDGDGSELSHLAFGTDFFGELWDVEIGTFAPEPPIDVEDNAEVCCSTAEATPPSSGGDTSNGAEPNLTPAIGAQIECAGGGLVDEQAPLTFAETWW